MAADGSWCPSTGKLAILRTKSIAWRELYAVVKALATFSDVLTGKRLRIHCDNEAVVHILESGASKDTEIMHLVRTLFYIGAKHHFECTASHLAGSLNSATDALSRLDVMTFFSVWHTAECTMTTPVEILCDGAYL